MAFYHKIHLCLFSGDAKSPERLDFKALVGVAQLVRAPDCGSGGRGFESHHSPHYSQKKEGGSCEIFSGFRLLKLTVHRLTVGCSQVGKAPDFDSGIRRFESCHPSHNMTH